MTVAAIYTTMEDLSAEVSNKTCLPLNGPVDAAVYADSGGTPCTGRRPMSPETIGLILFIRIWFCLPPRMMRARSSPRQPNVGRLAPTSGIPSPIGSTAFPVHRPRSSCATVAGAF